MLTVISRVMVAVVAWASSVGGSPVMPVRRTPPFRPVCAGTATTAVSVTAVSITTDAISLGGGMREVSSPGANGPENTSARASAKHRGEVLDFRAMEAIARYPDPAIHIIDQSFAKYRIANAGVERLATGFRWCEGPVWFGDGRYLLWSDIPNDRIMRWDEETGGVSVFRKPSNFANGNTRDRQGRLVTCEHDSRRVTRTEYDGTITVVLDRFQGKPLNSPNDVVVKSDDSVWFTDPPFGVLGNYEGHVATPELPTNVYRV